ncbi:TRAP transporter small permease [Aquamicrobium sp. LC103]|uniref:TRAP transporter small permease n=1 Tax=Aquamicrobium sp. LC103 TaxID=1120658 RepID=UPI00063EABA6|nr:TRAP transporter small permease [Aquamicrobium sp. LC103]TKT76128.1 TRAP transporter small permease [Aquamicrobium sp. LC103]
MNRILSAIEAVAGLTLAAVAVLIFLTAVLRYAFSVNLPDGFDFARYLQGIAILWGMTVATYRAGHISVDVVWEVSRPAVRRAIDIFAAVLTAGFFCVFAWALFNRLPSVIASGEVTADLRVVVWPFFLTAICGVAATAFVSLIVLLRAFQPTAEVNHG